MYYDIPPQYGELPEPKLNFAKSIVLIVIFMAITPLALATSAFSLLTVTSSSIAQAEGVVLAAHSRPTGANIFAALPDAVPGVGSSLEYADARVEIIRSYLARYNSPMVNHAAYIVQAADEFDVDFRLTTAIAQQESNLCKRIPPGTYNCWGWGIHSRGTLGFQSFEEGIRTVTRGLKREYIDKGLTTPEQIMTKYTPLSSGSWAFGVRLFMEQMK